MTVNMNWQFVEEFTRYWLIIIAFFSFPYALWKGRHINIDIVIRRFSNRIRVILAAITGLLALVIICYLIPKSLDWFWFGMEHEVRAMTPNNTLLWPIYLLIPFGLVVLSLGLLLQFYRTVMRLVLGEKIGIGNSEN